MPARRLPPQLAGWLLACAFVAALVANFLLGLSWELYTAGELWGALLGLIGCGPEASVNLMGQVQLRLWSVLTTAGVGASLAFSGALLQGVFRNPLAAPSIIGVTAGASVGAAIGVLAHQGYSLDGGILLTAAQRLSVAGMAFLGALVSVGSVILLARIGGRTSVPRLLLMGIAVNACLAGVLAIIHSTMALQDASIARALISWGFGNLSDRSAVDAALIIAVVGLAFLTVPFLGRELDLLASGEEDAAALGVSVGLVHTLAVLTAALAAATAVSVAGQIGFVGLVVPHLLRILIRAPNSRLLPLSILGGAVFLLTTEWIRQALLPAGMRPGAVMAVIGGPVFVLILARSHRNWERS